MSIIVFAKAPLPGFAKTRLAKHIGDQAAAKLASRMLRAAIEQAVQADCGAVELCCAPDCSHPQFVQLRDEFGITLTHQGEGDLGARMQRAMARVLQTQPYALLTGTDAPALDAHYLREAADALQRQPCVFAPTFDGGYALVGVRQANLLPLLFAAMPWSTPQVMPQTRARLAQAGISLAELAMLHDIDEVEDMIHLPATWGN
jgi:rSAM/selenodomain-associated transferase 1